MPISARPATADTLPFVRPPQARRRAQLRVVPKSSPPRLALARAQRRRDGAYAVTLSALLAVGVLGALFVNTSMQQQAREIAQQRALLTTLQQQTQTAQTQVDREAAPWLLAQRARALHMKQDTSMQVLRAAQAKAAAAKKPAAANKAATQRTVTGKRASPRRLMRPFHSG